jgi:hypothetical protein
MIKFKALFPFLMHFFKVSQKVFNNIFCFQCISIKTPLLILSIILLSSCIASKFYFQNIDSQFVVFENNMVYIVVNKKGLIEFAKQIESNQGNIHSVEDYHFLEDALIQNSILKPFSVDFKEGMSDENAKVYILLFSTLVEKLKNRDAFVISKENNKNMLYKYKRIKDKLGTITEIFLIPDGKIFLSHVVSLGE